MALARVWGDTGWRWVLIASLLVFVLEVTAWAVDLGGNSTWWMAVILTALWAARSLTMRPLRGSLGDPENLMLLLAAGGILVLETVYLYTTVGDTFAEQTLYWPYWLGAVGVLFASRLAAPYASQPLNQWVLLFGLFVFALEMAIWAGDVSFPEPPFTWSAMLTGAALLARWIAGRGFSGPVRSPLNAATALFVLLLWWLEWAIEETGIGVDPWGLQQLYWPWLLTTTGLAAAVRVVAPWLVSGRD